MSKAKAKTTAKKLADKCAGCSRVAQVRALQKTVALLRYEFASAKDLCDKWKDERNHFWRDRQRHEIHTLIALVVIYVAAGFTVGCYFGIYP